MKLFKAFIYYTVITLIYCMIFLNKNANVVMKFIGYGLLGLEAIFILVIFLFFRKTNRENKKLKYLLDNEKYEDLEKTLKEKLEIETNPVRKDVFNYYLMICYLSTKRDGEAILLYDIIDNKMYYPIMHYYKAAVEFYKGCYTNLENLYSEFINSYEITKNYNYYKDFDNLFQAMISYYKNDGKLELILKQIDFSRFKLNCTVKIIEKMTQQN